MRAGTGPARTEVVQGGQVLLCPWSRRGWQKKVGGKGSQCLANILGSARNGKNFAPDSNQAGHLPASEGGRMCGVHHLARRKQQDAGQPSLLHWNKALFERCGQKQTQTHTHPSPVPGHSACTWDRSHLPVGPFHGAPPSPPPPHPIRSAEAEIKTWAGKTLSLRLPRPLAAEH